MPKGPLNRQSIVGEYTSTAGLGGMLTQPQDKPGNVEQIDKSITIPNNISILEETVVEAPDGSKTVEVTLAWDDSGEDFEYEIQIGDIKD